LLAIAADINDIRKNGFSLGSGLSLAVDVLAAAVPMVPAVTGVVQRGARNTVTRAALRTGREAHAAFSAEKVAEGGWQVNRALGKKVYAPTRGGAKATNIIVEELKPNTASGRRASELARDKYRKAASEQCAECTFEYRARFYNK
jgi:hypothetical protein